MCLGLVGLYRVEDFVVGFIVYRLQGEVCRGAGSKVYRALHMFGLTSAQPFTTQERTKTLPRTYQAQDRRSASAYLRIL